MGEEIWLKGEVVGIKWGKGRIKRGKGKIWVKRGVGLDLKRL